MLLIQTYYNQRKYEKYQELKPLTYVRSLIRGDLLINAYMLIAKGKSSIV